MEFMARQGIRIDILRELPLRAPPATAGEVSRILAAAEGIRQSARRTKIAATGSIASPVAGSCA
jgi:hypothetical protein